VAHGRILDFGSQAVKIPASDAKDYVRISLEEKEPSRQRSTWLGFYLAMRRFWTL